MERREAVLVRYTGPWNLDALKQPPEITWVERKGTLRALYYTSEPYQGHTTRVFAYYAIPERIPGRQVPGMVLVHGGGGKAFSEWAMRWAERGYAALAMDLSGRGPDGERLPDGGPEQSESEKFGAIMHGLKETWPYHAVAAVLRAISVLAAQPEVYADRIGITGISWGGYLTCIAAGLDERLRLAIPVYGCGYLYEQSAWVPILEQLSPEYRTLWIASFDPSRYLPQARLPMLWLNGTNDQAYPLSSYQKSYRLPSGPRTLSITVGMAHSHPDGWAPIEIGIFADQVLGGGMPLAQVSLLYVNGHAAEATYHADLAIPQAALHYTTDRGSWEKRLWHSVPAEISGNQVRAPLPTTRPLVCFMTVTDERGATVSTEHIELRR